MFCTDFYRVKWRVIIKYLLSFQFRLTFGNWCIHRDVSSNCKGDSCCGRSLICSNKPFLRIVVQDDEVIENDSNYVCCGIYSEDVHAFYNRYFFRYSQFSDIIGWLGLKIKSVTGAYFSVLLTAHMLVSFVTMHQSNK